MLAAGDVATAAAWNVLVGNDVSFRDGTGTVPDMAGASKTGQSVANNTWTFLSFDTETFDTNTMFTATDTKITIKKAGVYIVTAFADFPSSGTGGRQLRLEKNAATPVTGTNLAAANLGGNSPRSGQLCELNVSRVTLLAATDTLHATVIQDSGGAQSVNGFLSVAYIGPTT